MILQNLMFPSVDNCTEEKFFFNKTAKTRYSLAEDCVYMKKKACIRFDTFYNSFSACKWFEYTNIEDIGIRLFINGKVRISVFVKKIVDNELVERCILENYYDSNCDGEYFDKKINSYIADGIYSISIFALEDNVQVLGGFFYSNDSNISNDVKLSVLINFANHDRYINKNINRNIDLLCDYVEKKELVNKIQIDIIDKDKKIKPEKINSNIVSVFKKKYMEDFSRQELINILVEKGVTNVLLLADDSIVIPETIYRTYQFLSCLKKEKKDTILLGTVLSDEHQWKNLALGRDNKYCDMRMLDNCIRNEEIVTHKYSSWWISEFPLKTFATHDLAEETLNRKSDNNIENEAIRINSLCVWNNSHTIKEKQSSNKIFVVNLKENIEEKSIIKLQNILFPSAENCTEELLYFRRSGDTSYSLADNQVLIRKNGMLNLDTYFNSFSASKWYKYTIVNKVKIRLFLVGTVRISLIYKEKTTTGINEKVIKETYFDSDEEGGAFDSEFVSENTNGMYCINILGVSDESEFRGGFYYTDNITPCRIGLAIGICTFKREKYVYKNMKMLEDRFLLNPNSELKDNLYINISDNAKTLDIERFQSKHIKVYENKNAGGAGGFTRTIIETKKQEEENGLTHILLMDDDVVMQPESIYRTYKILTLLKEEYKDAFIGGAMLRTDLQWFQTESGGTWNGGRLVSHKQGLDLRNLDACLYNEVEEKYEFNAWWYCTMPLNIINKKNLPMPIFIRGDDVEFGLRNMKHLILMNGICVWHEPFENKYSSSMFYYIFRNRLIDNAVRNIRYSKEEFLEEFKEQYFRELFTLRYKNAELLMDGVKDFLKGPEWLMDQDGEKLNQDIMSRCYKLQNVNDLTLVFDYPEYDQMLQFVETPNAQKKRKLTLNGLFGKHYKSVCVPVQDAHIAYFYGAYGAVNYDPASNKAFETYFDKKKEIELIKDYFKLKKEVNKNYDSAKAKFLNAKENLNGIEFWKKYLSLE